jgi:hypothetical protein
MIVVDNPRYKRFSYHDHEKGSAVGVASTERAGARSPGRWPGDPKILEPGVHMRRPIRLDLQRGWVGDLQGGWVGDLQGGWVGDLQGGWVGAQWPPDGASAWSAAGTERGSG